MIATRSMLLLVALLAFGFGLFIGYQLHPGQPPNWGVVWQALGVVVTASAVLVALFMPWMDRQRRAHSLRIRAIDALAEVAARLDSAIIIQRINPGLRDKLSRGTMPGLVLLEGISPQFDLLTSIEQMLLLDLTGLLRVMTTDGMNALTHREKFDRSLDKTREVVKVIVSTDAGLRRIVDASGKTMRRNGEQK